MSVIPMKLLTLAGPLEQFEPVARACVASQAFHPEQAVHLLRDIRDVRPFDYANPYAAPLRRAREAAAQAGIPLDEIPPSAAPPDQDLPAYFDGLEAEAGALARRQAELEAQAEQARRAAGQLEHLRGLCGDLGELWTLEYIHFRGGSLPRDTYDSVRAALEAEADLLFFPTHMDRRQVYGVYFTTRRAQAQMDALLNSLHFTPLPMDLRPGGALEDALADLERQARRAQAGAWAAGQELERLRAREGDRLLACCAYLQFQSACYGLRRWACRSQERFYLAGWVPAGEAGPLLEALGQFRDLTCVVEEPGAAGGLQPPTKLKNGPLGRAFRPFLELYGLPSYGEKDPSLFLAVTYCLFFGVMFGDVGQGLCLAVAGLMLSRWKKLRLGAIIACCGLSGAAFGWVYGSVFGFEDILPGFRVLETSTLAVLGPVSNVLLLLALSVGLGILLLLAAMVINMGNGFRQGDWGRALFSPNGGAGLLFYGGLVAGLAVSLATGVNLFVPSYVLPVLILPLALMLLREPLGGLLSRRPGRQPLGQALAAGLFELFETLLSYLTNTLSFLRVGAYAVTHVGLMLVVRLLADLAGGPGGPGGAAVMVLGNLFVMGFEGLLVGIQALRLEFYELFGRFYSGGGVPFSPGQAGR